MPTTFTETNPQIARVMELVQQQLRAAVAGAIQRGEPSTVTFRDVTIKETGKLNKWRTPAIEWGEPL